MPSVRPSTVASGTDWMDNGPSTLRRRVEAGKRSEWAQIVNKDLQKYHEETTFMKEQKKLERKNYASEILKTINLRATLNNPDIEKKEKESWRQTLEKEERSNAIVKRIQMGEEKLKALQLKQDRDEHVKILRLQKKKEKNYHELWNQKIINDAKNNIILSGQVKQKRMKEEKEYLLKTMNEHKIAKLKLIEAHQKQLKEEQKIADRHNNKVSGKYVTASETRKRETKRIDLLQTKQMKMGEKWVNRDAEKRIREQEHFANKSNGPAGSGKNYEIKAFQLMKKKKKIAMQLRRRELLEQMVTKKEMKLKKKIQEADFALTASAEKVKAGMYQAYYDEEKLRLKDQYAIDLKKQMEKRRKFKEKNPTGMNARMTDAEKTMNTHTLRSLGITSNTFIGSDNSSGKSRKHRQRGGRGGLGSGTGSAPSLLSNTRPESQIFLNTYDGDVTLNNESSTPLTTNVPTKEAPFHVDTVVPGDIRSATPFHGYRRNRDTAHEELLKSSRPGTSGASLYSSLRHSHNPRRSRSWFDDEL